MEQRIRILGGSGSGKSKLATELGEKLGLPVLQLDDIYWEKGWKETKLDRLRSQVKEFMEDHPNWIMDGNYSKIKDLTFSHATHAIITYPPLYRHLWQLFWREVVRRSTYKFLPVTRPPLNVVHDKNDMAFIPGTGLLMENAIRYYKKRAHLWINDIRELDQHIKIFVKR